MSKKPKPHKPAPRPAPRPMPVAAMHTTAKVEPAKPVGSSPLRDLDQAHGAALEAVIDETGQLPDVAAGPAPDSTEWPAIWQKVQETQAAYVQAKAAVDERDRMLGEARTAAEADRVHLDADKERLRSEREQWLRQRAVGDAEFAQRTDALAKQEASARQLQSVMATRQLQLDDREAAIATREAEATAGFSVWRGEQSQLLSQEVERLRKQTKELSEALTTAQASWAREEAEQRAALRMELAKARTKGLADVESATALLMGERERALGDREKLLNQREAQARATERRLEEQRLDLEADIESRIRAKREELQRDLQQEQARRKSLEAETEDMREQLAAVEDWRRTLGEDPAAARKRLLELERQRKTMETKLARAPTEGTDARLRDAEAALEAAQRELDAARAEGSRLRAQLSEAVIGVVDLDTARREAQAYKSTREALVQRLEALQKEVDAAKQANAAQSPFEACSELEINHAVRPLLDEAQVDLKDLAGEIRVRLATEGETKLYFNERVIRTFLAGMACSRLILLEGISGTGKTKLPLSIARVLGAGGAKIEIQAGWRDRQDLFGHYNTFERKYQETEFLKAVARAGTVSHLPRPMLVVLDEMNLSHPEQYFADVLSALEGGEREPEIRLVPKELPNTPELLRGGRVALLTNTWFIGTANQDETTKDFADKTYDRAHVMELPRHRDTFEAQRRPPRAGALAFEQLDAAFKLAREVHAKSAKIVMQSLEEHLAALLEREFEIGWGNRLERQIGDFVPAYLATGGTLGEAVDHLVATKLIRKVRGRHDIEGPELGRLRSAVVRMLGVLDPGWFKRMKALEAGHDVQSLAALDREGAKKDRSANWQPWWTATP